ncbi:phage tail tube protein [uncultured Duncaniella sp.]|uniref:phage tail tube protein n=1 Tax=uncultured Duncaniella sp. TaxID=2768039 RepID=UPI0025A9B302|nr:phage tail tube protein [uncultured Duncaniella sp.]
MDNTNETNHSVLDGTDLILSIGDKALGFSTGCKVSTSVETGERVTKEASSGKWKEKYVKSFSEEISSEGMVLTDGDSDIPTYDELKDIQLKGEPIDAAYSIRDGDKRTGKTDGGYKGRYIITSLELDGQAGDDSKYSVKLENSGPVRKIGTGLNSNSQIQNQDQ